jgi:putative Holliday junction resolvase
MNNTIGERAEITLKFKDKLEELTGLPVIMEDERLTSKVANDVLISADTSRKKRKERVDGMASVIILQSYLDRKGN